MIEVHRKLAAADLTVVVDYTGVGRPIVHQLVEARLRPIAVTITGGNQVTQERDGSYHVPKRDLVGAAQVLLQAERLKISAGLELAGVLVDELLNFRVRSSDARPDS